MAPRDTNLRLKPCKGGRRQRRKEPGPAGVIELLNQLALKPPLLPAGEMIDQCFFPNFILLFFKPKYILQDNKLLYTFHPGSPI